MRSAENSNITSEEPLKKKRNTGTRQKWTNEEHQKFLQLEEHEPPLSNKQVTIVQLHIQTKLFVVIWFGASILFNLIL
jgi:hypothetical protein